MDKFSFKDKLGNGVLNALEAAERERRLCTEKRD